MTHTEAAQVIAILVNGLPEAKFTEENARVYQSLILDLDREPTERGVLALLRTWKWKFVPTIAEIRTAVLEQLEGGLRSPEDAWGDVVNAIRFVGTYNPPPAFADPLVGFVVERMGWRDLCQTSNSVADRARFCELYAAERDQRRRATLAAPRLEGPSRAALPAPMRELAAGIGRAPR